MRTALTVAGSDSVGGAGIEADIKAMSVLGVHAAAVITAVTAQNTQEVAGIHPVPEEFIKLQLESVLKDCDIKAVKTGMLYSSGIAETVADILEDHEMPLIVDPVLVSGTGFDLYDKPLINTLKKRVIPMCELVTPNKAEAEALSGIRIKSLEDLRLACELIGKQGSSVYVKGGHFDTPAVIDYLYLSSEFTKFEYPKLKKSGHGSGCVLSSFITANMAKGLDVVNSIIKSRELIQESISTQYSIGKGDPVVNPMVKIKGETDRIAVSDALDNAVNRIIDIIPNEMIPSEGINIAMALKDAAGPEEIAAVDRRITVHNGIPKRNGPIRFGSAEHLSYILLSVMKHHPSCRCIMNLAYSKDTVNIIEEVGLSSVSVNIDKNYISESVEKALSGMKRVPDAIIDKNPGRKAIKLLAENPGNMIDKLEQIL